MVKPFVPPIHEFHPASCCCPCVVQKENLHESSGVVSCGVVFVCLDLEAPGSANPLSRPRRGLLRQSYLRSEHDACVCTEVVVYTSCNFQFIMGNCAQEEHAAWHRRVTELLVLTMQQAVASCACKSGLASKRAANTCMACM